MNNPFLNTPFGMSTEGNQSGTREMVYKRIGLNRTSFGINFFGKDVMILIQFLKLKQRYILS